MEEGGGLGRKTPSQGSCQEKKVCKASRQNGQEVKKHIFQQLPATAEGGRLRSQEDAHQGGGGGALSTVGLKEREEKGQEGDVPTKKYEFPNGCKVRWGGLFRRKGLEQYEFQKPHFR